MTASPPVVHYLPDEKFTNFFVELIRSFGALGHMFAIDPAGVDGSLRYTHPMNASVVLNPSKAILPQMCDVIPRCKTLAIHFMTPRARCLTLAAPSHVRVFWSGWGADYYHLLPGGDRHLLGIRTQRLIDSLRIQRHGRLAGSLKAQAIRLGAGNLADTLRRCRWRAVWSRVDLFSAPIRPDFELLRAALGASFRAGYCQVNYGSIEDTFSPSAALASNANRVLLGHSASPIGNQLDAAVQVPPARRSRLTLVLPLSYGDASYARALLAELNTMGFLTIESMEQFIPLDNYLSKTSSCGSAVFNAKRQCALGNIGAALCRGADVYLHPESPTYEFLRSLGADVESSECMARIGDEHTSSAIRQRAARNRAALEHCWGREAVASNARQFLRTVS